MIGLGLGLGLGGRAGGSSVDPGTDPATLTLTAFWDASFSASPWEGSASAGTSGAKDLAEATNPPTAGTAVNGLTPARFSAAGTTKLDYAGTDGSLIGTGEFTSWVIFNASAAIADAGAASRYLNAQFWTDSVSALAGLGFSDAGVTAQMHDGTGHRELVKACSTGIWVCAFLVHSGTTLSLDINESGTPATISTSGSYAGGSGNPVRFGARYDAGRFFSGDVLQYGFAASALSAPTRAGILQHARVKFGLTLA